MMMKIDVPRIVTPRRGIITSKKDAYYHFSALRYEECTFNFTAQGFHKASMTQRSVPCAQLCMFPTCLGTRSLSSNKQENGGGPVPQPRGSYLLHLQYLKNKNSGSD